MVKLGIGALAQVRGCRDHIGGIDAAAQIADDRHVGAQPDLDRAAEGGLELVDEALLVGGIVLVAGVGEVEVPVAVLAHLGALAVAAEGDLEVVAGQHRLHAFKHRAPRAHGEEGEDVVEPARVARGRDAARGQQRLDLGTEVDPVALLRPVQRANADAVAGEEDRALREVDQRQRELAFELREHAFAVLLVEVHDQLGVGVGAEDVALRLQLGLALGVVEQLAVEDDRDRAILVEDRLAAVAEADDGQAAIGKAEALADQEAVVIGSAVPKRLCHGLQDGGIGLAPAGEVDNSCNAAHEPSYARASYSHFNRKIGVIAATRNPQRHPSRKVTTGPYILRGSLGTKGASNKPQSLQAGMAVAADNNVVMHRDPE